MKERVKPLHRIFHSTSLHSSIIHASSKLEIYSREMLRDSFRCPLSRGEELEKIILHLTPLKD